MMNLLENKRLLISGVVNSESIAFAVARQAQLAGAEIALSAFPRDRALTEEAARALPLQVPIYDLDATDPEHYGALEDQLRHDFDGIDGVLHAIAFAPPDALSGELAAARPEGVSLAFQTSAFSLSLMGDLCRRLAPSSGGSVVALGFDADRAWPVYNWMGVCKAALDATARYMARDLGQQRIRVNVVAAGPLRTRAAGGIPGFDYLLEEWERSAPLAWDPSDPKPVASSVCFLLSDLAAGITGEVLHVDGGFHAVVGPRQPTVAAQTRQLSAQPG